MRVTDDLRARVRAVLPQVREALERLVRIPSLSAAGYDPAPVRESAALVAQLLREAGAETRVLEAPGAHPAVTGRIAGPQSDDHAGAPLRGNV